MPKIDHALIFAAGHGTRMLPLTRHIPKPLLHAGAHRLIEWHLQALARAGIRVVVINTARLAEQFAAALGDGARWNLHLQYSHEGDQPLETGGGMLQALEHLGERPFLAVNGDVWTDFDYARLVEQPIGLGHIVLVDNPAHHPQGDFSLTPSGAVSNLGPAKLTFSGIGVYRRALLEPWPTLFPDQVPRAAAGHAPRFPIAPLLRQAADRLELTGERYAGQWTDVGTPTRLQELDVRLRAMKPVPLEGACATANPLPDAKTEP